MLPLIRKENLDFWNNRFCISEEVRYKRKDDKTAYGSIFYRNWHVLNSDKLNDTISYKIKSLSPSLYETLQLETRVFNLSKDKDEYFDLLNFLSDIIFNMKAQSFLKKYKKTIHDIIITDISMPKLNGLDMISKIRKISTSVPIIILSAFSEKEHLFKAIDMSVNKYLVKPIDVDELLNIISEISNGLSSIQNIILPMGYSYNSKDKKLYLGHKFISLTKKETLFMDILTKDKTDYVSNKDIYAYVWNDEVSDSAVRTFIRRLRQKTNKDLIVNISGLGYRIKA